MFVPEFPFLAMAPWESVPSAREVVAQLQARPALSAGLPSINPTAIGVINPPTYPLVNVYTTIENHHVYWDMLVYQRVKLFSPQLSLSRSPQGHAVSARPHLRTLGWPFLRLRGDWLGLEA